MEACAVPAHQEQHRLKTNLLSGDMSDEDRAAQTVSHTIDKRKFTCLSTFRVQSVSTHIGSLEARIGELELRNKELPATIARAKAEEDPYNDQDIRAQFRALQYAIKVIVEEDFSTKREITGWALYDKIAELDDRDLFLQAYVAAILAADYFGDDALFFSYDAKMDNKLGGFDKLQVDRGSKPTQKRSFQL